MPFPALLFSTEDVHPHNANTHHPQHIFTIYLLIAGTWQVLSVSQESGMNEHHREVSDEWCWKRSLICKCLMEPRGGSQERINLYLKRFQSQPSLPFVPFQAASQRSSYGNPLSHRIRTLLAQSERSLKPGSPFPQLSVSSDLPILPFLPALGS